MNDNIRIHYYAILQYSVVVYMCLPMFKDVVSTQNRVYNVYIQEYAFMRLFVLHG